MCSRLNTARRSQVALVSALVVALALAVPGQAPFPLSTPVFGQFASLSPLGPGFGVADFNGDGREDVVAAWGGTLASIQTLPGGGYGPPTVIATWPAVQAGWVQPATCDLTGDGAADVLATFFFYATAASTTYLYPGTGLGSFGMPVVLPDPSGFTGGEHDCFRADNVSGLTTPGGPPAIILCARRTAPVMEVLVYTLTYQGSGYVVAASLLVQPPSSLGAGAFFRFWRSGDVNGDGLLDLLGVVATPPYQFTDWIILMGSSAAPYFVAPIVVPSQIQTFPGANFEVADVNTDGMDDVITRAGGSQNTPVGPTIDIPVYFGHPTAPLGSFLISVTGVSSSAYNVVEDFDGDGARDLLMTSVLPGTGPPPPPGVSFSRGDGQGHFGTALTLQGYPAASALFAAADENGDGLKDAVGYNAWSSPTFVLHNQSRIGPGVAGAGGVVPQSRAGIATPGNPFYFVGVTNGAANMPAVLAVSLGLLPAPDTYGNLLDLSPAMLILPTTQSGALSTNAQGEATWVLGLPPAPVLAGQTIYLEWVVADPGAATGYGLTPARKVVFW
jgi:hypothetical protein